MKKVAIIGTAYPYRGGIAAFNERLARQFQEEGWTTDVVTFTLQYPSFLFPGKTQYSTEPQPDDLNITRSVSSVNPFNWIKVGRRVRKGNYDLVVMKFWHPFMAPCLGAIARIIRKNKNTKVVSVLDNVIPHERHFGDKTLIAYFVKSMDGFVAMSQSVLDDLLLFDKKKPMTLSPHPLYDNFGQKVSREEAIRYLKLDDSTRYMLFFGIIRDYKGLDLLLDAFADARLQNRDLKLIVAGEFYNNEERYREQEKRLGLEGRIIWYDAFIPDSEVKYYFNAADIIAQPYKSATQSGVTQIAYHFEIPMLVTDVGGLKEIVPDGKVGYVVNPKHEDISDALVDFYDNNRHDAFVDGVKDEKKKYKWSNMIAAILSLFNEKQS